MPREKTKTMVFLGNKPVRTKIVVEDRVIEQVKISTTSGAKFRMSLRE